MCNENSVDVLDKFKCKLKSVSKSMEFLKVVLLLTILNLNGLIIVSIIKTSLDTLTWLGF